MFDLDPEANDDPDFIAPLCHIITGAVLNHEPDQVLAFKIDNGFGHTWLRSSGKTLGALGVWANPLTIPRFVANRRDDPRAAWAGSDLL
jgi:hypothetical protein